VSTFREGQRVKVTRPGSTFDLWGDVTSVLIFEERGGMYTVQTYLDKGEGPGPWPGPVSTYYGDELKAARGRPALPGTFGGPGAQPGRKPREDAPAAASGDGAILEAIRSALGPVSGTVDAEQVREIVRAELRGIAAPLRIEIQSGEELRPLEGVHHRRFPDLLRLIQSRGHDGHRPNVYLHGPAGTGKTSAAKGVAEALGLSLQVSARILEHYILQGFRDAGGHVVRTPFREVWEHGGVFLFDEIDRSDPSAVLWLNSALANGFASFPDGTVQRHRDAVVIGTGNTLMRGGDAEFSGAVQMDAAAVDRWAYLGWPIDETLEQAISGGNSDWLARVRKVRANVAKRIPGVSITPRATAEGAAMLAQGVPLELVEEAILFRGLTPEQVREVAG
jgi:cobaltochelatase CobS